MKNHEIEQLDFGDWPLPAVYLTEIGRVAWMWSCLESFMNVAIGKLAGFDEISDPRPFILVNHASVPQKLDMLSALCEHLLTSHPELSGYEDALRQVRKAQKRRNRFMHTAMSENPDTGDIEMGIGSARGTLKTSIEKVRIADIRRAVIETSEAMAALYKLVLQRDVEPAWKQASKSNN
jgi:hypothetical protein